MTELDTRYISRAGNKLRVRLGIEHQRASVGTFSSLEQAIAARDKALATPADDTIIAGRITVKHNAPALQPARASADQAHTPSHRNVKGTDTSGASGVLTSIPTVPGNVNHDIEPPLTVDAERWLYCSDLHVPLHNRAYIERLMRVARGKNIDTLVIGGDLFDFASSSKHPATEVQASLNDTLRIAGDVLVALAGVFARIVVLPGNHCRRIAKKLNEPLDFDALVHAALRGRCAAQFTITSRDYVYVGTRWLVGHPTFYEASGAAQLARAAIKERRHVIGAHTHLVSLQYTFDARHMVIYPGHMTDPDLTPYIATGRALSRHAEWVNGFVSVEHDKPQLYCDDLVDWSQFEGR